MVINKTNKDFKNNIEIENIIDKEYSKKMNIKEVLNITNRQDFSNYFAKICRENKKIQLKKILKIHLDVHMEKKIF